MEKVDASDFTSPEHALPLWVSSEVGEIFIGLVGAVGTNLAETVEHCKKSLCGYGYFVEEIRISSAIDQMYPHQNISGSGEDRRIDDLMQKGDKLRTSTECGASASMLAVAEIQSVRKIARELGRKRVAYVINSLKHPDEITRLREIYGKGFFVISVYSPRPVRLKNLCSKIAKSYNAFDVDKYKAKAEELLSKDEKNVLNEFGQNVRSCFPMADFFTLEGERSQPDLDRFFRIVFGDPFVSPSKDEFGQFFAKAAALRSVDLSRQVGAVISNSHGDIIATGCNEVPRAGGGYLWSDELKDDCDYRDFRQGRDANAVMKSELFTEIYSKLLEKGWINPEVGNGNIEDLVSKSLYGSDAFMKDVRAANIIEFGRIVHAEMAAITDAARLGLSTDNSTLYCTTFPCHMCARHIIAAGVRRVVYIEPYPKSMTRELYLRAVQIESEEADADAVKFTPFVGVSPDRFMELFEMSKRKDKRGYTLQWKAGDAKLKLKVSPYSDMEKYWLAQFRKDLIKSGFEVSK